MLTPNSQTVKTYRLSRHELDLIINVARNGSIAAGAAEMGLSKQTVKNSLSQIYSKMEVRGITQAIWLLWVEPQYGGYDGA